MENASNTHSLYFQSCNKSHQSLLLKFNTKYQPSIQWSLKLMTNILLQYLFYTLVTEAWTVFFSFLVFI